LMSVLSCIPKTHDTQCSSFFSFFFFQFSDVASVASITIFFKNLFFVDKMAIIIRKCKKRGDHPREDLAKSGYKPHMTYRTLIILLYLWLHTQNQM
jgi:hypothetical protein